jgi:hypothetical protein
MRFRLTKTGKTYAEPSDRTAGIPKMANENSGTVVKQTQINLPTPTSASEIRKQLSTPGRLPKELGTTKEELRLLLARLEAQMDIDKNVEYNNAANGAIQDLIELLRFDLEIIETDLVNSTMPYHGGAKTKMGGWGYNGRQLQVMLYLYQTAIDELKTQIRTECGIDIAGGSNEPGVSDNTG